MFGLNGQSGVLLLSADYVLKSSSKVFEISAIEILNNKYFDVINETKNAIQKKSEAIVKQIRSVDDFNVIVSSVLKARSQKSTNQNSTSSRSHLMIEFGIVGESNGKMAFFDLAGWEDPAGKTIAESQFINKTLLEFNNVLVQVAKKRDTTFSTPLNKLIKPYLTGSSQALMLFHVSNKDAKKGFENIKDVVASCKEKRKSNSREPFECLTNKLRKLE